MALLDNTFRSQCRPLVVSLDRTNKNGDGDIVVVFSEAKMVRHIFSKMEALHCLYTAQIIPRTDDHAVEVVAFDRNDTNNLLTMSHLPEYFRRR